MILPSLTDIATHPIYNQQNAPNLKQLDIFLQFVINRDNTLQLAGCGIGLEKANGQRVDDSDLSAASCENRLQKIYGNSPVIYDLQGVL